MHSQNLNTDDVNKSPRSFVPSTIN